MSTRRRIQAFAGASRAARELPGGVRRAGIAHQRSEVAQPVAARAAIVDERL